MRKFLLKANKKTNKYNTALLITSVFVLLITTICGLIFAPKFQIKQKETTFYGYDFTQQTAQDSEVTFNSLNMTTSYQKSVGSSGSGSQWPIALATSSDGELMLYGTDVGGVFKSTDHGNSWSKANTGLHYPNVVILGIDPKNNDHAVCLSKTMFYSLDGAKSWNESAVPNNYDVYGERYLQNGVAFDETSYDGDICKNVYFSAPFLRDVKMLQSPKNLLEKQNSLPLEMAGLYYSTDGGKTFELFINDIRLSDGMIVFNSENKMIVGSIWGLFEVDTITKQVIAFEQFYNPVLKDVDNIQIENGKINADNYNNDVNDIVGYENIYRLYMGVTGLDVVGDTVYFQTWYGLYTLKNGTITKINSTNGTNGYPENHWGQYLQVSKTNPKHMAIAYKHYSIDNAYTNDIKVSFDGGESWIKAEGDNNSLFLKNNNWYSRVMRFVIDPSNDKNVVTFCSDVVFNSNDGGLKFKQVNGISNMMVGGKFNYNYYNSDIMFFSAQDYRGAVSLDGGNTFKSFLFTFDRNEYGQYFSGYGHMYGGFASDEDTYYGFVSTSWSGPFYLAVTHDGGDSWTYYDGVDNEQTLSPNSALGNKAYSSMQSYNNPNILYAEKFISFDNGYTWQEMVGCNQVQTINPTGNHELYGTNESGNLVVSYDDGRNWSVVYDKVWCHEYNSSFTLKKECIYDTAIDFVNNYVYAVVLSQYDYRGQEINNTFVYKLNLDTKEIKVLRYNLDSRTTDSDGYGYSYVRSIAIDPNCTSIIYLTAPGGYYSSFTSLIRSVDGGETFSTLTANNSTRYPTKATNEGGYQATTVRVLPTGRVMVNCGCYGIEYFDAPYGYKTENTTLKHKVSFVVNGVVINNTYVNNNCKIKQQLDVFENVRDWYYDEECTKKFDLMDKITSSVRLYAKIV